MRLREIINSARGFRFLRVFVVVTNRVKRLKRLNDNFILLRPHFYGLGYPRQPSPRVTLAEVTFILFLSKIQSTVYIMNANSSRGARKVGELSHLGRQGNPGKRDNFSSCKHFSSPTWDSSRRGECHVMPRFRI